MFMARHQSAGKNNLPTANKSFENQSCIQEKMNNRLISGNTC
jgi:hypothetical protein